jgi:plastocyanin domain-containing protein
MSNSKMSKQAQENSARKKSLEERMAAQKAAELAFKRKRALIIGGIALGVVVIIVLIVLWSSSAGGGAAATVSDGVQRVTTSSGGGGSENITVKAGTQVVWTINASRNLGCRGGFQADSGLGISKTSLKAGQENTVKFTPKKKGTYTLRCQSMGMIYCKVTVI